MAVRWSTGSVRRAPLPLQLLVPRRCLGARRAGRAGGRARAVRPGGHRPPGPLRRGPVRRPRRRRRHPAGHRHGDRAARRGRRRIRAAWSCRARRPGGGAAASEPTGARSHGASDRPVQARTLPPRDGRPADRARRGCACPAIASRGQGGPARRSARERGPHLVLLARDVTGYRSLCRLVARRNLAGTKGVPRFTHELLARAHRGPGRAVGLPPRRDRAAAAGRRSGGRAAVGGARRFGARGSFGRATRLLSSSSSTTCCPTTTGWSRRRSRLADELGLPVVVTNDAHYARPRTASCRTCWRHPPRPDARRARPTCAGRTASTTSRAGDGAAALPPGDGAAAADPRRPGRGRRASRTPASWRRACSVDLGFEQYRFPGFPVPNGRDAVLVPRAAVPRRARGGATTR